MYDTNSSMMVLRSLLVVSGLITRLVFNIHLGNVFLIADRVAVAVKARVVSSVCQNFMQTLTVDGEH